MRSKADKSQLNLPHGVYLCPSVTHRNSVETDERIELIFFTGAASSDLYCKEMSVSAENQGIFFWNFVQNSGLTKFRHG